MVLADGFAVLNADDSDVLAMAPKCPGKTLLFSTDAERPELVAHRVQGGRTVALCGERIRFDEGPVCVAEATAPAALLKLDVPNLLAALGGAWALGIAPGLLKDACSEAGNGLTGASRVRSRFAEGCQVFVTLARNPSAIEASIEQATRTGTFARRIAIQSQSPQDWRREEAFTVGSLLGNRFDDVRLAVETHTRHENVEAASAGNGQPEPELIAAFVEGVKSQNHADFAVLANESEVTWTEGLARCNSGDLLFVQVGNSSRLASFSLPEEGLPNSGSSSVPTGRQRDGKSPAEV
jgi:cyanophycin synthetase